MIAVFYHCWLPDDQAIRILCEQMLALKDSGLAEAAFELHIVHDGGGMDGQIIKAVMPAKADLRIIPGHGEAGTLNWLRDCWLPGKIGWDVCYHHIKGASHPGDRYGHWRHCMERAVIWNWRACVERLRHGCDTVGAHWYTPYDQRYWAGNFWWAKADYLKTLPPIPPNTVNGKSYEAEVWIGKSKHAPRTHDFAPHLPQTGCR